MTIAKVSKAELFEAMQALRAQVDELARMLLELEPETPVSPPVVMEGEDKQEYYSVRQLANRYGVSVSTLYRWVREGRFPAGHAWGPRTRRWKRTELEGLNNVDKR
ncbi:MAG: helix-turn-helix domain-containing protein [Clostridia bacterium]|nr:helix-turn-helix domain-containing protein [Clostridia bacterium]